MVRTFGARAINRAAVAVFLALCLLISCGSTRLTAQQNARAAWNAEPRALPAAAGAISCQSSPSATANAYLICAYTGPNNASMAFYLYVPHLQAGQAQKTYPLVMVLHGGGEMAHADYSADQNAAIIFGQDYVSIWGPGSPPGGPSVQAQWPCYVVVPQTEMANRWVEVPAAAGSYRLTAEPSVSLQMAMEIVQLVQRRYTDIDPQRRYVTGISMGGYGVWDAIERWPAYFAAAVPIAGAGSPALASRLVDLPIWAFHGADDKVVPVSGSRDMIQAIRGAGGRPCYTEYPASDHGVWGQAYDLSGNSNNPLYDWLFAQRRGASPQGVAICSATT